LAFQFATAVDHVPGIARSQRRVRIGKQNRRIPMSYAKTLLVAVGVAFSFATFASAAPRAVYGSDQSTSIAGKAQQDRFSVSYH
jgi:hypothetical protein